ncbi:HD family phosphohydrolase [Caryophanon latum]|uniref:Phosphohydrolase n=1 Tax=Caryophanon latum TaxID=33977 RepID=A0A1C0Z546_9BACL|nr:HDIG domain-containing metalloprotein [Caryophanon latum]OCS94597.1 phosphohydrolase [Caryophanon latum]
MQKKVKKISDYIGFRYFLLIVLALTGLVQFLFMHSNIQEYTYTVEELQLAPETIRSPKTIVDEAKTEQDRLLAAEQVEPVYTFNESMAKNQAAMIDSFFGYVTDTLTSSKDGDTLDDKLEQLKKRLSSIDEKQFPFRFTDEQLKLLLSQQVTDLEASRALLSKTVGQMLTKAIREDDIASIQSRIEQTVRMQSVFPAELVNIIVVMARSSIVETETYNEDMTDARRQQAKNLVEETRILQGQIIVQEGERVTKDIYRQLELLGLLNDESNIRMGIGLSVVTILQMCVLYMLFNQWGATNARKQNAVTMVFFVYVLGLALLKILSFVADEFTVHIAFLFPTALTAMLLRLLINEKVALITSVLMAATAGVMMNTQYGAVMSAEVVLYVLFGSVTALLYLRTGEKTSHVLKACALVSTMNALYIFFYIIMTQTTYTVEELVFYASAALVSGMLSGMLTLGLLPFFESGFGILSTMRLIELSNPNHPLLKKILTETPGTYHHSIMVANLAETACEAIGADGLLARVGCYYHDIGKTKRPAYFIENQMGKNPHDDLPPDESARIIIEHTTYGAQLLAEYKMPQEIIDIALQHHGTSELKFFVHKAKELGIEVADGQFRYPGSKPQTKEAAIISVADSVEAAVRSLKDPTPEKIRTLIQSITKDRLLDHQFDECDISVKELKQMELAFCETLNGIFHSRIEYPKD